MKPIVVLGSGGMAREVVWLIDEINTIEPRWDVLGFSDVDPSRLGTKVGKHEVRFTDEELDSMDVAVAVGIGDPNVLRKLAHRLTARPPELLPNLVHPSVGTSAERVKMGNANILCAGTVFTIDIRLGSFNIVNVRCSISHDVVIGDAVVISPGATIAGGVAVGSSVLVGAGSTVLQYRNIGEGAVIGAGAVVTRDVPAGTTVVGVPARPLKRG